MLTGSISTTPHPPQHAHTCRVDDDSPDTTAAFAHLASLDAGPERDPVGMYLTQDNGKRSVRTAPCGDGRRLLLVTGEGFTPGEGDPAAGCGGSSGSRFAVCWGVAMGVSA